MNDLRSLQDMLNGTGDSSAPRKPKSLVLADMLDADARSFETKQQAAVELRRMHEENEALRQALDKPEIEPQALVEMAVLVEREACAKVLEGISNAPDMQAYANAIRARGEKPPVKTYCGGKPNYCIPVDAVNMTQDRVDETAKREHEPVAWFIQYEDSHEFVWSKPDGWRVKQALEIQPLYTAPPKRECVGLTDEDYEQLLESKDWGGSLIQATEAKLKEKNQ